VVKGPGTSEETFNLTYKLLEKVKKRPVKVLKELPGYLVNRIQSAMYREVFDLWARGIASPEDIDRAVKDSMGFRLASVGPLLTSDLAGFYKAGPQAPGRYFALMEEISTSRSVPEKLCEQWNKYQGIYEYPQEELDRIAKQRDREFIRRFKDSYQQ
jgi:3-hydroxybutyryl-CoA dehydrogenase